jgi:crossover junction endodeoxyribonuclease RuvC
MRILGIDPGSVATGFGVVERAGGTLVHVAHGTVRRRAAFFRASAPSLPRACRAAEEHRPDAVAV